MINISENNDSQQTEKTSVALSVNAGWLRVVAWGALLGISNGLVEAAALD